MARVAKLAGKPFRSIVVVPKVLTYHLLDAGTVDKGEPGDVLVVQEIAGRVINSDSYVIPEAVVNALIVNGVQSEETDADRAETPKK